MRRRRLGARIIIRWRVLLFGVTPSLAIGARFGGLGTAISLRSLVYGGAESQLTGLGVIPRGGAVAVHVGPIGIDDFRERVARLGILGARYERAQLVLILVALIGAAVGLAGASILIRELGAQLIAEALLGRQVVGAGRDSHRLFLIGGVSLATIDALKGIVIFVEVGRVRLLQTFQLIGPLL